MGASPEPPVCCSCIHPVYPQGTTQTLVIDWFVDAHSLLMVRKEHSLAPYGTNRASYPAQTGDNMYCRLGVNTQLLSRCDHIMKASPLSLYPPNGSERDVGAFAANGVFPYLAISRNLLVIYRAGNCFTVNSGDRTITPGISCRTGWSVMVLLLYRGLPSNIHAPV